MKISISFTKRSPVCLHFAVCVCLLWAVCLHLFVYFFSALDGMKDKFQIDLQHSNDLVERIHFERSLLFWSWGEKDMAIKMMKGLMKKTSGSGPFKAESLTTMASWLWNSRSVNAQVILKDYYQVMTIFFFYTEKLICSFFPSSFTSQNHLLHVKIFKYEERNFFYESERN